MNPLRPARLRRSSPRAGPLPRQSARSRPSSGSLRPVIRSRRRTKISRRPTGVDGRTAIRQSARRHLPKVAGIPSPKDILGYHIGAPRKLTYYADIVKYYRALAAATPRVKVETIGKSDEGASWSSCGSRRTPTSRACSRIATTSRSSPTRAAFDAQIKTLIAATKPHYHFMGGLHSSETGPSEMLMELVYRLARDVAVHLTDSRQRVRVGHAGG